MNIEGLGQGFRLRCQPLLTDSNWLQDALLGVALTTRSLRTATARMDLQTGVRPQLGNWAQ